MATASTNAEKRQRIAEALREDPHCNNTDLARRVGTSWNTIARVRQRLERKGEIPAVTFANGGQNKLPEVADMFSPQRLTDEEIEAYALRQAHRCRREFLFRITRTNGPYDWFWYALPHQKIERREIPRDWRG